MKNKKCCWSECNKIVECSIATNSSKGDLDMCKDCYDKYNKHCSIREEMFMRDALTMIKKSIMKADKEIDYIFHPELKYGSHTTNNKNRELKEGCSVDCSAQST